MFQNSKRGFLTLCLCSGRYIGILFVLGDRKWQIFVAQAVVVHTRVLMRLGSAHTAARGERRTPSACAVFIANLVADEPVLWPTGTLNAQYTPMTLRKNQRRDAKNGTSTMYRCAVSLTVCLRKHSMLGRLILEDTRDVPICIYTGTSCTD